MKKALPFIIYFIGCFFSYQMGKSILTNNNHTYTNGDKLMVVTISIFSWITAIAEGIIIISIHTREWQEKPVNW